MNDYKYPGLLTISTICKVIGIVIIIFAVIGFFYGIILLIDYEAIGSIFIISSILGGLLFSIPFFAFGELIKVFIRIEFNTRKEQIAHPNIQSLSEEHITETPEIVPEIIPEIVSTSGSKIRFSDNVVTEVIEDADVGYFFVSHNGRHYYRSYNSAVNASYVYKKTKKILDIDLL